MSDLQKLEMTITDDVQFKAVYDRFVEWYEESNMPTHTLPILTSGMLEVMAEEEILNFVGRKALVIVNKGDNSLTTVTVKEFIRRYMKDFYKKYKLLMEEEDEERVD